MVVNIIFLVKNRFCLLFLWKQVIIPPPPSRQYPPCLQAKKRPVKKIYHAIVTGILIVCVQALSARMTAGLSHGMPGHGSGICPGPMSVSMMHTADSTWFPSGGGARTAMHSWMICGERGNRRIRIRYLFFVFFLRVRLMRICAGRKRGE